MMEAAPNIAPVTSVIHADGVLPLQQQLVLMLSLKWRCLANTVDRAIAVSPLRTFLACLTVLFSWVSLYLFFHAIFRQIYASALENLIAQQFILDFFFIALLFMLLLSNAVLCFGALFGKGESPFLLCGPIHPVVFVSVKYGESLALSSWSLLLLGLPMMFAFGQVYEQPWPFYPLFVLYFLAFITVPAGLGLLTAFVVTNYLRPVLKRGLLMTLAAVLAAGLFWVIYVWQTTPLESQQFLARLYDQISPLRNALIPSTWMSAGLIAAANNRLEEAWRYWFILLANGLFFSWMSILWVAHGLFSAFDCSQSLTGRRRKKRERFSGLLADILFCYLSPQLRAIVLKDLRSFLRQPAQWSQMLIFFALLLLYILNIRNLPLDLTKPAAQQLLGFLNLTSIALIMATFTGRFVFPLPSLETWQMWLLGVAPITRRALLWCKWALSTVIVISVVLPLTLLSAAVVALPVTWTLVQVGYVFLLAAGLNGMAMGWGARFAMLNQRNATRIASGLGGTLNLVLTIFFVIGMLLSYALAVSSEFRHPNARLGPMLIGLIGGLLLSVGTVWGIMNYGIRHFERREF